MIAERWSVRSILLILGSIIVVSFVFLMIANWLVLSVFTADNLHGNKKAYVSRLEIGSSETEAPDYELALTWAGEVLFDLDASSGDALWFRFDEPTQRLRYAVTRESRVRSFGSVKLRVPFYVQCSICRILNLKPDAAVAPHALANLAIFKHQHMGLSDTINLCEPGADFGFNVAICLSAFAPEGVTQRFNSSNFQSTFRRSTQSPSFALQPTFVAGGAAAAFVPQCE